MSKPNRFTSEEIENVLKTFTAQQEILLEELHESDKKLVQEWINQTVLLNPILLLKPDSILTINDQIFSDPVIQNYVLDLVFRFFTLAGDKDDLCLKLCQNLSEGLSIDGPKPEHCNIPQELKVSMPLAIYPASTMNALVLKVLRFFGLYKEITVKETLISNKHLVIVLLTHVTNTNRNM
jgi:hypothetical protein